MFQNQDTNKSNNEPEIEDIPVHTMQEDLAEINNPGSTKTSPQKIEPVAQRKPINQENFSAAQKSSPFLNATPEIKKSEPPKPGDIKINSVQTTQSQATARPQAPTAATNSPKSENKRPFIMVAAGLIIILVAGSGYLFWITRQPKVTEIVEVTPIIETTPEPDPEPVKAETFSTDKANYLIMDLSNAETAKSTLQSYADKVAGTSITSPVEFIITDAQNNPILFSEFAIKTGLTFSKPLMANLKESFSLFIYKDGPLTRIGLSLSSKSATKLKALLSAEEKNLAKELEPVLLSSNYTLEIKSYGSSTYQDLAIRYANITSPEDLSIDYAISSDKLLIGTTKMTLRSIIDYLAKNTAQTPTAQTNASKQPATDTNTKTGQSTNITTTNENSTATVQSDTSTTTINPTN